MKREYATIWKLALPYYKKGRPMDVDHIDWMIKDALLVCEKENIDDSLLLPLVILHDVGYAEVPKENPFNLDLRKAHMAVGAKISRMILESINYPRDKIEKIVYYISVHDNWAFGDNKIYCKDIILGVFNDLDYTWMATPKGFLAIITIKNIPDKEMLTFLRKNEKPKKRPFVTETTRKLYEDYLKNRENEIKKP